MFTIETLAKLVEANIINLRQTIEGTELNTKSLSTKIYRGTELTVAESVAIVGKLKELRSFLKKYRIKSTNDLIALRDDKRVVMSVLIERAGYPYHTVASYMSRGQAISEESCEKYQEQLTEIVKILDKILKNE
ncbi:MAG TPA: hypothetical protein PLI74_13765 [Candidatus Kapabacteria bacterium]|nr:hypothetical protein [Candidatus Kapabacteria bacterium]